MESSTAQQPAAPPRRPTRAVPPTPLEAGHGTEPNYSAPLFTEEPEAEADTEPDPEPESPELARTTSELDRAENEDRSIAGSVY